MKKLEKSWINIQDSNIQNIFIPTYKLRTLILSGSTVHGSTMVGVTEIENIRMRNTKFIGHFHCASITNKIDANRAVFNRDFSFASTIYEYARFNSCRFLQSCLIFSRDGKVFGDDAQNKFKYVGFDQTIFDKPTQTLFQDVDLRKASFKSVSLVGIRFYNTNFYQSSLNRNGLYNEVIMLEKGFKEAENRHLIHEYRQLRMAMENNKDYIKAHDFYIGEMEARQRGTRNWIILLYKFSSFYGTDYKKAFKFLFLLFCVHFLLTVVLSTNLQFQKLFYLQYYEEAWTRLGDILVHSLNTITLQKNGLLSNTSFWQKVFDVTFRIIFPIQAAMFVLALRNMTKR